MKPLLRMRCFTQSPFTEPMEVASYGLLPSVRLQPRYNRRILPAMQGRHGTAQGCRCQAKHTRPARRAAAWP
nr:MAG TPA: hypothetical protein [Caudoviricetes sp.]